MKQTKPLVILHKYRSIFFAAAIVEVVTFLVSLTDTIVAGNEVGAEALMAIGLMSPFYFTATFLAAVINSGTLLSFSDSIGAFQKKRALEFFSQGVFLSIGVGVLFTLILLLFKKPIIGGFHISETVTRYVLDYYEIILFYFLLEPISCLLDNIIVADGGEKLSAALNVAQIASNVALSVILAKTMGVRGIALATVLCKLFFVLSICGWFFSKRNSLKLVKYFHPKDCLMITKRGIVRATTFAMTAATTHLVNAVTVKFFEDDFLQIVIVSQKILGMSSIFLGLAMTLQPLIGTLRGENNTKAARALLKRAVLDIAASGGVLTLILVLFARPVVRAFGVREEMLVTRGVFAVYITSSTLVPAALLVLLFICFFLFHRYKHALVICFIKDFLAPVGLILMFAGLWNTPDSVWIGLSASSVLSVVIIMALAFIRNGWKLFPILILENNDENIYIYSFIINDQNAVDMSVTAGKLLKGAGYSSRLQTLVSMYIEDLLLLIKEKNKTSEKELLAECNLILDKKRVRVILRDSGIIFDITDEDTRPDSFRQYLIANMISALDIKTYIVTTGYNRNEFVFTE